MSIVVLEQSQIEQISRQSAQIGAELALEKYQKPLPKWMTIEQVRDYLQFKTVRTVYKKIDEEGLPYSEKLGVKRFDREKVDAWMNGEI
jgi:predicted DNA-binding transcriptional regulator AlpA